MILIVSLALCAFIALLSTLRTSIWVQIASVVGLLGLWAAQLQSAEASLAWLSGATADHALALAITTLLFVIVTTLFNDPRYTDPLSRLRYSTMAPSVMLLLGSVSILALFTIDLLTPRPSLIEVAYNYLFPAFWVALGSVLLFREPVYTLEPSAEKASTAVFDNAGGEMQPAS